MFEDVLEQRGALRLERLLFGMLFDALHKSRTTLYRAPAKSTSLTMAPLTAQGRHGLAVTLRF